MVQLGWEQEGCREGGGTFVCAIDVSLCFVALTILQVNWLCSNEDLLNTRFPQSEISLMDMKISRIFCGVNV